MDYLKYDWCTAGTVYQRDQYPEVLHKMSQALAHAGRPMVYSIHGRGAVWTYSAAQSANLWRSTGDINDTYARMLAIGFGQEGLERFAGPGHWNDPDMLEVGNGGMKDNEYRMHMSLWCLLSAPFMAGNDLTKMTPQTCRNPHQPRGSRPRSGPRRHPGSSHPGAGSDRGHGQAAR